MLTSVAALWEGVSVLRHRDWWRRVSHVAAASLPLVLAAALVTALQHVDGGGGSVIILGANPVAFHEVWRTTALSFGPVLVIAALAAASLADRRPAGLGVRDDAGRLCAVLLLVDVRDHQDVYVGWRVGHLWFISSVALAAVVYQWVSAMRRPPWRQHGRAGRGPPRRPADHAHRHLQHAGHHQPAGSRGLTWTLVLSSAEQEAFA